MNLRYYSPLYGLGIMLHGILTVDSAEILAGFFVGMSLCVILMGPDIYHGKFMEEIYGKKKYSKREEEKK